MRQQTCYLSGILTDEGQRLPAWNRTRLFNGEFPKPHSATTFQAVGLSPADALQLFQSQCYSRCLDLKARELKEKNLSFYTIGSSGHEGNASIGKVFSVHDMAFLHYRSGAFVIERARQNPLQDPVRDILLSLVASKEDPIANGRHKVFGSVALNIPPQTSTIASQLPKALGAAFSITRAKDLNLSGKLDPDSVIFCSFGDASVNHAAAQTTLNAAHWLQYQHFPLPLVFCCEDNGLGISMPTPQDWVKNSIKLRYIVVDGLNLADTYRGAIAARDIALHEKIPVFLHMKCVRLFGHAGSDIQQQYLSDAEIQAMEYEDPLMHSARQLISENICDVEKLWQIYQDCEREVAEKAEWAKTRPKLNSATEVMSSLIPKSQPSSKMIINETQRQKTFGDHYALLSEKRNLAQHINYALTDLMLEYPNILVFGEDVAKKGGVYRVTADLQHRFGQRRVFNTLLDETTIIGSAIGLSMNGFIPIPEIQFLAYVHNAEDQIRGEAATLSFFSSQQYQNPMVIRIAGLGYQKGFGGHFHNDNSIAVFRDIPGIIVACPSHGANAAKLLRSCVRLAAEEGRICIFLEPIALYMTKDLLQPGDNGWLSTYPDITEEIAFGEVGIEGEGTDCCILTYGNGYYLSRQAVAECQKAHKLSVKIVDLQWLVPLPKAEILAAIKGCQRVLIVDECRKTGSLSEEIITLLVEHCDPIPQIQRLTGLDTFIPLGNAWQTVLPSKQDIMDALL